ncbi:MAG: lysophospholipid acyltransferase family protein [Variibacter sp.]
MRVAAVAVAVALLILLLLPLQALALLLRLPIRRTIPVFFHRAVCRLLGVRIRLRGSFAPGPALIVANHVSWLDICVVTAIVPVAFVAKREVSTWPVFGLLARLQRSVFIDRTRRSATVAANRSIGERLANGDRIVLFAEGTSSDGNRVLPFRSSLIAAVETAADKTPRGDIAIQPAAIAYTAGNGVPLGRRHRPRVAWYGDLDLLPHLAAIIRRGAIDVTISAGEPIRADAVVDRKTTARDLEARVRHLMVTALRGATSE